MATVTRQFKENFEKFAQHRIDTGQFTLAEAEEFRKMVRADLMPGPDQLRGECEYLTAAGVKVPAVIDDENERYRVWDSFFAEKCKEIGIRKAE